MKQQLVEHTNRVMKWTFGALQGSLLAKAVCPPPTPLPAHSTSGAEPALATWPQLKMRKVDEKSKKFSVCPRSLSLPSLAVCLPLFPSRCQQRNEMKFSVELPAAHAPSKSGGPWNGRFCWVAVASASAGRRTETGTLLQHQLQQHMGQ